MATNSPAAGHRPLEAVVAVDHEARKEAALARQQINQHEDYCGKRWEQAHGTMAELKQAIKDLHHRINFLVKTAFMLILALLGFAAVQWLLASGVAQ